MIWEIFETLYQQNMEMIFEKLHVQGSKEGQKCRKPLSRSATAVDHAAANCKKLQTIFLLNTFPLKTIFLQEIFFFNTISAGNTTTVQENWAPGPDCLGLTVRGPIVRTQFA